MAEPKQTLMTTATVSVVATTETVAVPSTEDAADDAAIWVNPADGSRSVIIGTNKRDGLAVYTLDGNQLHYYSFGRPNNVDVRQDFRVSTGTISIAATEDRDSKSIRVFAINPVDQSLAEISSGTLSIEFEPYGCGLYTSVKSGKTYFFVGKEKSGLVGQFELIPTDKGQVDAKLVRTLKMDSQTEGIVADDRGGVVFIGEEERGIWKFPAEPDGGTTGTLITEIGPGRPIKKDDVEGLAIYDLDTTRGYLIASSQGSNEFAVFDRQAPHAHLGTFNIAAGAVDKVSETDGIAVTSANLGQGFESGLFVAQDGENDGSNQNFKLVGWAAIAAALGLESRPAE